MCFLLNQITVIHLWSPKCICYKVMQVFMETGLFAGQHNTELHGTITDVLYTIVGSALLKD